MDSARKIYALSLLWKNIDTLFPYFDRCTIELGARYLDFLPRVAQAEGTEYHLLLAEFLAGFGDGHTDYTLPKALREARGMVPFAAEYDEFWTVRSIAPDGAAHLGARILAINGIPFAQLLREIKRYCYHSGDCIYPMTLDRLLPFFVQPTGNVLQTEAGEYCFRLVSGGERVQIPSDTDAWKLLERGKGLTLRSSGGILCAEVPDLMHRGVAARLAQAIANEKPREVLLDLRGCIGGMTALGAEIAQLFLSGKFPVCEKWTRRFLGSELAVASQYGKELSDETLRRVVGRTEYETYLQTLGMDGVRAIFDGPLTVLTSRATISAAEELCAMLRASGRARFVGQPTCGSTGTPLLLPMPDGGFARIVSIGTRLPDGTEFIGRGIAPDVLTSSRYAAAYCLSC